MVRHLWVLLIISILIAGCNPSFTVMDPSTPCEELIHPAMLSIPFDGLARGNEETKAWILTEFPTATFEYTRTAEYKDSDYGSFSWSENGRHFSLSYIPGGFRASQGFAYAPRLGHIRRCFGDPTYYALILNFHSLDTTGDYLELWYPQRGLRFLTYNMNLFIPRSFNDYSLVERFVEIYPVDTIEETIHHREPGDGCIQEWPENFTKFVTQSKEYSACPPLTQ